MRAKKREYLLPGILSAAVLVPVFYMAACSFAGDESPGFSLMGYYTVLFSEPGYLLRFWRSLAMCGVIAAGQSLTGCMGGAAIAKYRFAGSKVLAICMAVFMILPVQATLLPNYIFLDRLHLLNSWWALILPGIFAPFGTVWMAFAFRAIPGEVSEAAEMDGAGMLSHVFHILIPAARPAVITLFVLSFVESWNMVEQPVTFLKGVRQYPMSVFLASIDIDRLSVQAVCGILCLAPVTFLFFYYQQELLDGIGESIWS